MFVVSRCNGTEVLDPVEVQLDHVAQLVDTRVEGWRIGAMIERTDVGIGPLVCDFRPQHVVVVAPVGEQNAVGSERAENILTAFSVVRLALSQLERDREPVAVDDRVVLGRKPAAGTSHATAPAAFLSPFAEF